MPEQEPSTERELSPSAERMIRKVGSAQERMAKARQGGKSAWSSIAILGVVGWSVALPTLVGVLLGAWLDHRWPGRFSWTLTLMMTGLALGCWNAWLRVKGDQS